MILKLQKDVYVYNNTCQENYINCAWCMNLEYSKNISDVIV